MNLLISYIFTLLLRPYVWGGDDPIEGFDCSGFVQEVLASVGLDPPGDQSAQALYNHFEIHGERNAKESAGVLVFYGASVNAITHVAIMIDPYRVAEYGGGGSKTVDAKTAAKQNAYGRIRHMSRRKDVVAKIKPRYATIGLI